MGYHASNIPQIILKKLTGTELKTMLCTNDRVIKDVW